jgi:hypothetical protein
MRRIRTFRSTTYRIRRWSHKVILKYNITILNTV